MNRENTSRVERDEDDNDVEMVEAGRKVVYVDDVQDGDGQNTEVATWTEVFGQQRLKRVAEKIWRRCGKNRERSGVVGQGQQGPRVR